jgi:hypothetical protein
VGLGEKIICLVGAIRAAGRVDAQNMGRIILIFWGNSQSGVRVGAIAVRVAAAEGCVRLRSSRKPGICGLYETPR